MGEKTVKPNLGFDDICFCKVTERTVRRNNVKYMSIDLKRDNGREVIIKTPILVCRGLKEDDGKFGKGSSDRGRGGAKRTFKFPLEMNSGGTRVEREFLESFRGFVEKCKDHLTSVRDEIGDYEPGKEEPHKTGWLSLPRKKVVDRHRWQSGSHTHAK